MIKILMFTLLFLSSFIIGQTPIIKKDVSKLYGIADKKTGLWLTKPIYKLIVAEFADSLNKKLRCFIAYNKKDECVFIDKSGKKVISQKFDYAGKSGYNTTYFVSANKKYSFYAPETNVMQKIGWVDTYELPFSKKKYLIKLIKDHKFCIVDLNKADTAIFLYDNKIEFFNSNINFYSDYDTSGFALVKQNNKFGVLSWNGKVTIPCIYDTLIKAFQIWDEVFIDDYFIKIDNKWGVSSDKHKILISPNFESIDVRIYKNLNRGYYAPKLYLPVKENGKWGIIDSIGNYTIKNNYDTILNISNSEIVVKKNGKMGIIDFKENTIFPFIYDYAESTDNNFFKKKSSRTYLVNNGCKKCSTDTIGGLWGIADANGKLIQPIDAQIIKLYRNYNYLNSEFDGSEDSTLIGYIWNRGGEKKQTVISVDTFYNAEATDINGNFFVDTIIDKKYSYTIKGGKSGIMNTDGKEIITIKYDDLALTIIRDDKPPILDKYISQPSKWYKESYFTYEKQPIYFKIAGKTGCMNFKNQIIIPALYDSLELIGNNVEDNYFNGDSIVILNVPELIKEVYVAYLNGSKQFYATTGKPLGLIEKDVSELPALNFFDANDKFPFVADYYIAAKNAVLDTFYTYNSVINIDENEKESLINVYNFFYTSAKGKYNIINPQTHNYMLPNWADDIIFCPRNLNDLLRFNKSISNLNQQLDFFYSLSADSLFTKKGKFVNFYSAEKYQAYSNSKFSGNDTKSIFCYKQNNQWFLFDVFNNKIINANNGYDSILFNGKSWVANKNNIIELYAIDGQKQK